MRALKVDEARVCSRADCEHDGSEQPLSEFARRKDGRNGGYKSQCKSCKRIEDGRWRRANLDKCRAHSQASRDRKLPPGWPGLSSNRYVTIKSYGLDPETYLAIYNLQNGRCAICHALFDTLWSAPIDHCHVTGRVCGLLCAPCNTGIGSLGENSAIIASALTYVTSHKGGTTR